jgi:hypothetical protein
MDGASMEAVLYCIHEFQETANEINFEINFDTGNELFNNFCHILRGAAKDDWDSGIALIQNPTPVAFLVTLDQWKSEMILPTAHQTLVDCLETLSKPHQMTVEAFVNCLTVMVQYVDDIPSTPWNRSADSEPKQVEEHHLPCHDKHLANKLSSCVHFFHVESPAIHVSITIIFRPSTESSCLSRKAPF